MSSKILVVDDEDGIIALLTDFLLLNDYEVITAKSGFEAMEKIKEKPDLVLLDINMPGINGVEVCKRIREKVDCPIIFLTARTSPDDLITGFNVGGDDYITKPFNIRELGVRIQAHLRRERRLIDKADEQNNGMIINYAEMTVKYNDAPISLTKTEFEIIELLSTHPGQIFDREKIYETVRGLSATGDNTVITEHIRRIRTKFIEAGSAPRIETVWGVGYKWTK